jgi:transposase
MAAIERFVGLDVHRQTVTVAAVDAQQQVVLPPREIAVQRFFSWARAHLHAEDRVALEATSNAWDFYDQLTPFVAEVKVANTFKLKLITSGRVKTDKHDALVLAKLNAAKLVPDVWVPPQAVRELRTVVTHRQGLLSDRSAAKNRLHSILHRHNLSLPKGNPFSHENRGWWQQLPLSCADQLRMRHALQQLQFLETLIAEVDQEIARLSIQDPWREQVAFVMQVPGVGLHSAMVILSAIGEIERFPTAKHLVGYSGLGASVHASGQTYRSGSMTKQGRRELRTVLVECAWIAVRWSAHWREQFRRLVQRMSKPKAIVAIARKLLVVIWHVLSKRTVDRQANPEAIARSFLTWIRNHRLATLTGQSMAELVWQELDRLGIGEKLEAFTYGSRSMVRPVKTPS